MEDRANGVQEQLASGMQDRANDAQERLASGMQDRANDAQERLANGLQDRASGAQERLANGLQDRASGAQEQLANGMQDQVIEKGAVPSAARDRADREASAEMRPGVLVISHGSREPGWVAQVEEAVAEARSKLPADLPVAASYLELVEGRLIQDGVRALEAQGVTDIYALPLFVSSGSTHVDEIGWALGAYAEPRRETDLEPVEVMARLTYGQPIGSDPQIARVLADKLGARSREPAAECVLLIGHGSDEPWFYEAWRRELEGLAAELARIGGFAGADAALLRPDETAARIAGLRERYPQARLLAVPVFLSEGYFTSSAVPGRLAGQDIDYAESALLPHPQIGEWIVHRARAWLETREAASPF
ncbi:sirohydrochlorin chelatase [Cohnella hashimotonis]|uniref:CbiX/SirB N-terminal domain-containing protein n=1 Tax=Cohnella hashimotonis TaxID=2826895 RepID=A0ABT6TPD3_9BACL|nr:CbiX/SirB N-terminal domain-containing protein [Cohnella hashimotonis]MDI4648083.1 CbiX/SirB N-terminal domain-containing protein [Cohnella hashimotonis]